MIRVSQVQNSITEEAAVNRRDPSAAASLLSPWIGPTTGVLPYKDSIAKSATQPRIKRGAQNCGGWASLAQCQGGHSFAKKILCGREWCEVCGQDNSAAHKRRQARILPKLQQVRRLGYFVVEFPEFYRHLAQRGISPDLDLGEYVEGWCYSKSDLDSSSSLITEVFAGRRCGRRGRVDGFFDRGLMRWHFYGEKRPGKWNPHVNLLVDVGSLSAQIRAGIQGAVDARKAELRTMKRTRKVARELRGIECYESGRSGYLPGPLLEWIQARLRAALNVPDLIVHYSYVDRPGQIVQKARYVTRATFLQESWDPYMAEQLYAFRNMRWWGRWQDPPAWGRVEAARDGEDLEGLEAVARLQEGVCPDCGRPLCCRHISRRTGKPVYWSKPTEAIWLQIWDAVEIAGTGYYRIGSRDGP